MNLEMLKNATFATLKIRGQCSSSVFNGAVYALPG